MILNADQHNWSKLFLTKYEILWIDKICWWINRQMFYFNHMKLRDIENNERICSISFYCYADHCVSEIVVEIPSCVVIGFRSHFLNENNFWNRSDKRLLRNGWNVEHPYVAILTQYLHSQSVWVVSTRNSSFEDNWKISLHISNVFCIFFYFKSVYSGGNFLYEYRYMNWSRNAMRLEVEWTFEISWLKKFELKYWAKKKKERKSQALKTPWVRCS